jgi:hypothetical protein
LIYEKNDDSSSCSIDHSILSSDMGINTNMNSEAYIDEHTAVGLNIINSKIEKSNFQNNLFEFRFVLENLSPHDSKTVNDKESDVDHWNNSNENLKKDFGYHSIDSLNEGGGISDLDDLEAGPNP